MSLSALTWPMMDCRGQAASPWSSLWVAVEFPPLPSPPLSICRVVSHIFLILLFHSCSCFLSIPKCGIKETMCIAHWLIFCQQWIHLESALSNMKQAVAGLISQKPPPLPKPCHINIIVIFLYVLKIMQKS